MMGSDATLEPSWEEFDFRTILQLAKRVQTPSSLKSTVGLNPSLPRVRVSWALEHLPPSHALSSSFGAQAAVGIHLLTRQDPKIPVILIDTGYLFPETYRFIDELSREPESESAGVPRAALHCLAGSPLRQTLAGQSERPGRLQSRSEG